MEVVSRVCFNGPGLCPGKSGGERYIKSSILKAFYPLKAPRRKLVPSSMEKECAFVRRVQSCSSDIIIVKRAARDNEIEIRKIKKHLFLIAVLPRETLSFPSPCDTGIVARCDLMRRMTREQNVPIMHYKIISCKYMYELYYPILISTTFYISIEMFLTQGLKTAHAGVPDISIKDISQTEVDDRTGDKTHRYKAIFILILIHPPLSRGRMFLASINSVLTA